MELAYQLWKPAAGRNRPTKKIVFLHGMGGTGALWRPIAATLEDDFEIFAPDQRGHGRSRVVPEGPGSRQGAAGFTPLDFGKDLVDTTGATGFYPAWVVGHSMGVRAACAFAHLTPDRVRGLILVDLGFSGPVGGGLGDGLAKFVQSLPSEFPTRAEAREFMERNSPDPSMGQYLLAVSVAGPDGRVSFPFDHSALIATIQAAKDTSVRGWVEALAKQGLPILVIRGERSLVWSRDDFEKERSSFSSYSNVRFEEFAEATHGLPFEQRALFVQRILSFTEQS